MNKVKNFTGQVLANDPMQVAKIIFQQLGGSKFIAMTGANGMVAIGGKSIEGKPLNPGIGFYIGRNNTQVNYVRITLTPMDEYDMEFFKAPRSARGAAIKLIKRVAGAPVENMHEIFTRYTGMDTSLGTSVRRPTNTAPGKPITPPAPPTPPARRLPPGPMVPSRPPMRNDPAAVKKQMDLVNPPKGKAPPKPAGGKFYERAVKVGDKQIANAFFHHALSEGLIVALVEDKYILCQDKVTFEYLMHGKGKPVFQNQISSVPYAQVLNELRG